MHGGISKCILGLKHSRVLGALLEPLEERFEAREHLAAALDEFDRALFELLTGSCDGEVNFKRHATAFFDLHGVDVNAITERTATGRPRFCERRCRAPRNKRAALRTCNNLGSW